MTQRTEEEMEEAQRKIFGKKTPISEKTKVTVNQRGHYIMHGSHWDDPRPPDVYELEVPSWRLEPDIIKSIRTGELVEIEPEAYRIFFNERMTSCAICDEHVMLDRDGTTFTAQTACKYPEGMATTYTFTVTSGKVVVDDDLRHVDHYNPDMPYPEFRSYNTRYGQHQAVLSYAERNMAYGPVGNSCPSLYEDLKRPGHYIMANAPYDDEWPEYGDSPESVAEFNANYKHLASVCTDLWAYSIADFGEFVAHGGSPDYANENWSHEVIDFPNGTYRVYHHTTSMDFDHDASGMTLYADFVRVGDA